MLSACARKFPGTSPIASLPRSIARSCTTGVVDVADVDAAVSWGPGLRWGIMGPNMLYHLGGGAGGIEHFFDQFSAPVSAWWKVLGNPVITPEVREVITKGVHEEAHARTIPELEAYRDEVLLGILELRKNEAKVLGT